MGVRVEDGPVESGDRGAARFAGEPLPPVRRINVSGDLEDLLDHRPFFRTRLRGYDRLQVDNYATWVEGELAAVRRQADHLLARYGQCAVALEQLRGAPSRPQRSPELATVTERLGEMLRLAAEEAAAVTAAGIDEAERIVAEARTEAQARLDKVEGIREAAVAAGEEVRRERSEAAGILARARAQAAELLSQAAAERGRLANEAAERLAWEAEQARRQRESAAAAAAARLTEVQHEVDALRRQRDEARDSLHRLTARINEALQAAASVAVVSGPSVDIAVLADRREPLATSAS
jgi:cell division septum initiation protein DivIVA